MSEDTIELARLSPSQSFVSQAVRPERPKINLHHAARDNRLEIVEQWIKLLSLSDSPRQLNNKDSLGYAPVHYAAKFNRFKILTKLVEAGADPNSRTREEFYTPLHFAARYTPRIIDKDAQLQEFESTAVGNSVEVGKLSTSAQAMQYLVNLKKGKKVKVNAKARYGLTPLHLACQRGNRAAVSVLLRSNDVIVSISDENKDTPLHEACLNGHDDIVENLVTRMLLEDPESMDIDPQNSESQTPLQLACREGYVEVVKTLLKHVTDFQKRSGLTRTRDNEQNTALHLACECGVAEIVRILISNGADLLATKLEDVSPMHLAARYGFIAIAEVLLSSGEDLVNSVEIYNQTPLHYAATNNQVDMINFLIDRKADVTATDTESYTPLMLAAREGHVEAFNVLFQRGSAIDETDEDGKTVVHLAAEENHVDILKLILKNRDGFKLVNSTDSSYNTPLHLAASNGNQESVEELLKSAMAAVKIDAKNELNKTPIHLAASKGHVPVIETLLKYQKDSILDEDEDGNTPLHLSAINGFWKSVNVLLDNQADFDARNATLWTPMDCAASNGHGKVVAVLIEAGADVNPTDKLQITPLHLAAQEGHLDVVKILLANNADVGKCSINNLNSLDMAIDNGHEDIALLIIKSKQWKSALRNTSENALGVTTTPLRKLIKKMPDVAEEVFNRCSIGNETKDGKTRVDSRDYMLTFNYEFLEDFQDEEKNICTRFFRRMFKRKLDDDIGDSGDTDAASGDMLETKTRVSVDLVLDRKRVSKHGFTTNWGPVGFSKKLHPLSIMVEHDRTDLLKHPLVTSLLKLKWRTYGRNAYFSNLFFFAIFVIFLTAFALVVLNPRSDTCVAVFGEQFGITNNDTVLYIYSNGDTCDPVTGDNETLFSAGGNNAMLVNGTQICSTGRLQPICGVSDPSCGKCGLSSVNRVFLVVAASIVISVALVRLLFEMFQLINLKIYYVLDWVNWIEVLLFIFAIIFVFVYFTECFCPTNWQWQLGCIAVFLTWINLIIFIRKIPLTGIYVLMFLHIFYTFCKMIILTLLLIIAFSIAFYMAFFDPSVPFMRASFATPGRAIIKTMTMTTGEFEYDAIFRQFPGGDDSGNVTEEVPFLPVSFLLWIIFLVLMPILLTNLLVGLAVDDIKGIQDAAVLKRLALQVELALSVEELLPIGLRRYFITEEFTIVPNRKLGFLENLRYIAFGESSRYDSQENIVNALHPQPTPIEQVQQQTRNIAFDMTKMKDTITELAERNILMERLIREMVKNQRVGVGASEEEETRSFI